MNWRPVVEPPVLLLLMFEVLVAAVVILVIAMSLTVVCCCWVGVDVVGSKTALVGLRRSFAGAAWQPLLTITGLLPLLLLLLLWPPLSLSLLLSIRRTADGRDARARA